MNRDVTYLYTKQTEKAQKENNKQQN